MLKKGEIVPLALQLFDGSDSQKVRVVVVGPSGTSLFEGELEHKIGGLYQSTDFQMPDLPFVIAQYEVLESNEYGRASDTFLLCDYEEITRELLDAKDNKYDNYYQCVVVKVESDDFMEGVIDGIIEAKAS